MISCDSVHMSRGWTPTEAPHAAREKERGEVPGKCQLYASCRDDDRNKGSCNRRDDAKYLKNNYFQGKGFAPATPKPESPLGSPREESGHSWQKEQIHRDHVVEENANDANGRGACFAECQDIVHRETHKGADGQKDVVGGDGSARAHQLQYLLAEGPSHMCGEGFEATVPGGDCLVNADSIEVTAARDLRHIEVGQVGLQLLSTFVIPPYCVRGRRYQGAETKGQHQ